MQCFRWSQGGDEGVRGEGGGRGHGPSWEGVGTRDVQGFPLIFVYVLIRLLFEKSPLLQYSTWINFYFSLAH